MKNLPSFMALRANFDTQEQFVTFATEGSNKGCFEMSSAEGLYSPKTKLAIEPAGDGGLVHIRCCFNNKYLCRAPVEVEINDENDSDETTNAPESCMIALGANKAIKEKSAWDCTLFQIIFHDGEEDENGDNYDDRFESENIVSLIHIGTNYSVMVIPNNNDKNKEEFSLIMKKCGKKEEAFHFTAMRSVMRLPPLVNFKGDNDHYLRYLWFQNRDYNQFSGTDGFSIGAMYEIIPHQNRNRPDIRVRSRQVNRFWRRSPNWIWADSNDTTWNNRDTIFEVFHIQGNEIVLQNHGNRRFCSRFTHEGKTSVLHAGATTMNTYTRLRVEEPIVSRSVIIAYQHQHSKVIHMEPELHSTITRTNIHYNTNEEERPNFNLTRTATRAWSQTNTISTSQSMTITAGIPFVNTGGEVSFTSERSQSLAWGQEASESEAMSMGSESLIVIKPRTRAIISAYLLRARYEIPFHYVQNDLRATGERIETRGTDGICTGFESYHYEVKTVFESIDRE